MKSEADLKNLLSSAEPDSLVVVKFHAIMCDASKAIEGKFRHTAAEFGVMDGHGPGDGQKVTFADVCFDSNRQLCEKMGIRSVPHVQVFFGPATICVGTHPAKPVYITIALFTPMILYSILLVSVSFDLSGMQGGERENLPCS